MLSSSQHIEAETDLVCLSDFSLKDKVWDVHGLERDLVRDSYLLEGHPYARRMTDCSQFLEFALKANLVNQEVVFKLQSARFCRVRHCPICSWRRSLFWRARFFQILPRLVNDYPNSRFLFLTLTVRNCHLSDLRLTLSFMNKAWDRLAKRARWPALGWVRSTEVTRSKDASAHPHFHALLMVPSSYFARNYISQSAWSSLWKDCLKVTYMPIVNVKVVKSKVAALSSDPKTALISAVCETLKYSVKVSDLVEDPKWLLELTNQLYKTRAIATGGVFKTYLSALDIEPENLIHTDADLSFLAEGDELGRLFFSWQRDRKRYVEDRSRNTELLGKTE